MRNEMIVHADADDQHEHAEYKRIYGGDKIKILHDGFSSYRMNNLYFGRGAALIRRKSFSLFRTGFAGPAPKVSSALRNTLMLADLIAPRHSR